MSNIDYTKLNERIVEQAYKAAERCLECGDKAQYIRHTQFAGDHPYCLEHAQKETDWKSDDSYTYWSEVVKVSAENDTLDSLRVGDARDL
jgi:hypothetical protein